MKTILLQAFRQRFKSVLTCALTCALAYVVTPRAAAQHASGSMGTPVALHIVEPPRMLNCSPVTPSPCFFLTFSPVDANGSPSPVALPPHDVLLRDISLDVNGGPIEPFFVSTGTAGTQKHGIVLIVLDISGSMKEPSAGAASRFDAAREAIDGYLASMQEGLDEVAIVPFNSQGVVPTIQSAVFSSRKSDLQAQLAALPRPAGNTALFQAVFTGVETLEREVKARQKDQKDLDAELDPKLIVMTDGRNEVLRGDDAGLLNGPLGLQQAAAKVQASRLPVIGIGFGKPEAIDAAALTRLSTRHFLAENKTELAQVFRATETRRPAQVTVGFLSPSGDRASLAASDLHVVTRLTLPGSTLLESEEAGWHAPAMGTPLFHGHASKGAMEALIRRGPSPLGAWNTLVRGLLVFLGCSAFLLLLRFALPRLIWHEGADETMPADRWGQGSLPSASGSVSGSGSSFTKPPAGFVTTGAATVQVRSAAQVTQVRPRSEFSHTRRIVDEKRI